MHLWSIRIAKWQLSGGGRGKRRFVDLFFLNDVVACLSTTEILNSQSRANLSTVAVRACFSTAQLLLLLFLCIYVSG